MKIPFLSLSQNTVSGAPIDLMLRIYSGNYDIFSFSAMYHIKRATFVAEISMMTVYDNR